MSLAAKVRAFQRRLTDASVQARSDEVIRVLVIRGEIVHRIVTHIGEARSPLRRTVCTERQSSDTDKTLATRHEVQALAATVRSRP